jgi:threonine/homoserine/homoserine lactone efflux protein
MQPTATTGHPDDRSRAALRDADGMAVAAFVLGLVGLLVMNVLLGPAALVLATLALRRGTTRRFRAWLGLGLGAADLIVLATVADLSNTVSWNL